MGCCLSWTLKKSDDGRRRRTRVPGANLRYGFGGDSGERGVGRAGGGRVGEASDLMDGSAGGNCGEGEEREDGEGEGDGDGEGGRE